MDHPTIPNAQIRLGSALVGFTGAVLLIGSVIKFLHPAKAAAYMAFFGYTNERLLLVSFLEFVVALVYLLRSTRPFGLLLASAYLGGAIAVHVAYHPMTTSTPIIEFDASHPYLGCIPPIFVLFCAWGGVWLQNRALVLWPFKGEETRMSSRATGPA